MNVTFGFDWGLVSGLLIGIYLLINLVLPTYPGGFAGTYVAQPVLWGLLAWVVVRSPTRRPASRARLRVTLIQSAPIIAVFQIALNAIAGLFEGFGKSPYSFTPRGILTNLVFVGSALLGVELSRAWLISRFARRRAALTVGLATLLYTIISISPSKFTGLVGAEQTVKFLGSTCLPLLAENLLASLLAFLAGPWASVAYRGTLEAFEWFCPILPDLSDPIKTLVGTLAPVLGSLMVHSVQAAQARPRIRRRERGEESAGGWIMLTVVGVMLIWFSLGLFPFAPTVVISGSMRPAMDVGDVVIVAKVPAGVVRQGDIIQFRTEHVPIMHRVVEISQESPASFITKGDANDQPDSEPVLAANVVGKVIFTIPQIGWASIAVKQWLAGVGSLVLNRGNAG